MTHCSFYWGRRDSVIFEARPATLPEVRSHPGNTNAQNPITGSPADVVLDNLILIQIDGDFGQRLVVGQERDRP